MLTSRRTLPLLSAAAIALAAAPAAHAAAPDAGRGPAAQAAAKRSAAKRGAGKGAKGKRKPAAARGGVVLSGRGRPSARLGRIGDVYLRTSDQTLWGPKTRRGWGRPSPLRGREGPSGREGRPGAPGQPGTPGAPGVPGVGFGPGYVAASVPEPGVISIDVDTSTGRTTNAVEVRLPVRLPAGISLVQLRMRGMVGGMLNFPSCTVELPSMDDIVGASEYDPPRDFVGLASTAIEATAWLRCSVASPTPTTASGNVAGTEVFVYPLNLATPPNALPLG